MPTYLGALFFGLPLWILLFYLRRDLRHKMILMSIFVAIVAPVDAFFIPEYWNPVTFQKLLGLPIDLYTILFGFTLGGISSIVYEEVMKKTYVREKKKHPTKIFIILGPISLFVLEAFTSLNFMVSVLIATIIMVLIILMIRHDLLIDALLSGLYFGAIYTILLSIYIYLFPYVLNVWSFHNFPQALVFNVPQYEIVWSFLTGMFLGPLYEFSHDFILRTYKGR